MAKAALKAKRKAKAAEPTITGIKGFDQNLQCRGYQFEIGQTYEHDGAVVVCRNGFHAITDEAHPLAVFDYYAPGLSRYCEVSQSGTTASADNIKIASAKITIGAEISISDLTKRAIEWVFKRAVKSEGSSATGYQGAASATGYQGAASATGYQGAASATGTRGAASATGDYGAASATGTRGAASATGEKSGAAAFGYEGRVSGKAGSALFALERDDNWNIVSTGSGIVGQDGLKPDTFYVCKGGKLVECGK